MSIQDPRYVQDSTITSTSALLTRYETAIVNKFMDMGGFVRYYRETGQETHINQPGLDTLSWDIIKSLPPALTSRDGREESAGGIVAYTTVTENYISTNYPYFIQKEALERARLTNHPLDLHTAEAVAETIANTIDYNIWNIF